MKNKKFKNLVDGLRNIIERIKEEMNKSEGRKTEIIQCEQLRKQTGGKLDRASRTVQDLTFMSQCPRRKGEGKEG